MAFGFTPKFEQDINLKGLAPKHYLAIALDAAKQLEWKINYVSKSGFIAFIGGDLFVTMEQFNVIIQEDKVFITSKSAGTGMYDLGKNKKHVELFIETFETVQASLSNHQLDEKILELAPVFESVEENKLAAPPANFKNNLQSFFALFIPRKDYFITPFILDINILVFIAMVISGVSFFEPGNEDLLRWGANMRSITLEGQWWRLITNIFLHIGVFHLLFNMYALLYIGLLLEPYLGKVRFATAYLLTGIAASLTSIYWHPLTISAGASGAIFGIYGVFLSMLTTNFIDKSVRKPLLISISVFVLYNLMNGMKEGIDNAAHIGGLVTGLVIGYAYYPSLYKPAAINIKYITVGLLSILILCTSFVVYHNIPDDFAKYKVYMQEFADKEQLALTVFKLPLNTPKDEILIALNEKGIKNWQANLQIVNKMDQLDDMPPAIFGRSDKLRKYCKLRIKCYEYISKDIDENSTKYQVSIDSCNTQIEAIINDLKSND
jgi:rhomboid protease GluP